MVTASARCIALTALRTWRTQNRSADRIFAELAADSGLSSPDRGFALELFYGVLRNLTLLDFWIAALRPGNIDPVSRDLLQLGLYQLFLAGVSPHAGVFETVKLAPKRARGLVNAILRGALREHDKLAEAAAKQPLTIRMSHPEFLIDRWENEFGANNTERLCEWNNQPPPIYARINQLKIALGDFRRRYAHAPSVEPANNFVEFTTAFPSAALESGLCYIQDPSTRLACLALDPRPGENILDACAAPGGKTSYIAELMRNEGTIVAVDRQLERVEILQENLTRLDVKIASVVRHDWRRGEAAKVLSAAPFDRILVDAPCTNTGVMRRRVDVRWRLRATEFDRMQQEQLSILRAIIRLLKRDGVLVYSTCSLEAEENERLIRLLSQEQPMLTIVREQTCLPFRNGFDGAYVATLVRKT